ncbi:PD-(D/E)XK motif protein [Peribacillus sp. NPDC056705]|uniref:PD-(D/E)XK motif protein n=1 Tax=Peribacillus sp. NPDC056705 TaxID=3345918 RepID=UPI0037490E3D
MYELKKIFDHLASLERELDEAYLIQEVLDLGVTSVLAGLDADHKRCVIIPIKLPIERTEYDRFPKWNGLSIVQEKHVNTLANGEKRWFLIFKENKKFANINDEIIIHIFEDICKSVQTEMVLSRIFDKIRIVLRKWEDFFHKIEGNPISKQILQGLFGELLFLKHLLIEREESQQIQILNGWYGIDYAKKDFQYKQKFIEIKTSTQQKPYSVRVSSDTQLKKPDDYQLYLCCFMLEVDIQLGKTIKMLIEDIESLLLDDVKTLFKQKLMNIGIIVDLLDNSLLDFFIVRDTLVYEITEQFPIIKSSELPSAVFKIEYSLALDQCADFKLGINRLLGKIEV